MYILQSGSIDKNPPPVTIFRNEQLQQFPRRIGVKFSARAYMKVTFTVPKLHLKIPAHNLSFSEAVTILSFSNQVQPPPGADTAPRITKQTKIRSLYPGSEISLSFMNSNVNFK